jgi:hypothetical protein
VIVAKVKPEARASETSPVERAHLRLGWLLLLAGVMGGVVAEGLLGFKWAGLMSDPLRRELLRLAHFHAGLLGLVNLVYARFAEGPGLSERTRRTASQALWWGSVCLPSGFLLGGLWHPEGDPGLGIVLVPIGAAGIVLALSVQAHSCGRRT